MKYLTSGNPIVDAMAEINISGNVTPQIWYKTILRENGKPYLLAIAILSDIVYWYRPLEVRNEENGGIVGWKKKFKSDLLQKSYRQYAELFGESLRSVEAAMKYLQSIGVITRVPRDVRMENGVMIYNVTFLQLNVDRLYELTYPFEDQVQNFVGGTTKFCTTPYNEKGEGVQTNVPGATKKCGGVPQENARGTTEFCTTNTENTTKNTAKNSINLSCQSEDGLMDIRATYEEIIKDNIEYDYLVKAEWLRKSEIDELVTLMVDTVSYDRKIMRIGGRDVPYQEIKSRFLKLKRSHIEYVLESLESNCTNIKDTYRYNLTALFNAPTTIANHYRALVNKDMYGVGNST